MSPVQSQPHCFRMLHIQSKSYSRLQKTYLLIRSKRQEQKGESRIILLSRGVCFVLYTSTKYGEFLRHSGTEAIWSCSCTYTRWCLRSERLTAGTGLHAAGVPAATQSGLSHRCCGWSPLRLSAAVVGSPCLHTPSSNVGEVLWWSSTEVCLSQAT